jgi:hypothetical protein
MPMIIPTLILINKELANERPLFFSAHFVAFFALEIGVRILPPKFHKFPLIVRCYEIRKHIIRPRVGYREWTGLNV